MERITKAVLKAVCQMALISWVLFLLCGAFIYHDNLVGMFMWTGCVAATIFVLLVCYNYERSRP